MKAVTKISTGIGLAVAGIFFISKHQEGGMIREFSWTVDTNIVRYSLTIENRTAHIIDGLILVVAETKSEGHDGVTILPRGSKRIDV